MKYYYSVFRFSFLALLCLAISPAIRAQVIFDVAGNGNFGYYGDGGKADTAEIGGGQAVAVDGSGNIYIAEYGNSLVRKITKSSGIINTIVGVYQSGSGGYSGDTGPATLAEINSPTGIAVDNSGNIFIADQGNNRIRRVDGITGIITTYAGNGTAGYSGNGGLATSAEINRPYQMTFDAAGNLYFVDAVNATVQKIDKTTGIITTIAGNGIQNFYGDSGKADTAEFIAPCGIAIDKSNNIFIADQSNNRIRRIDGVTNIITTIGGDGNAGYIDGVASEFNSPTNLSVDSIGNLYITDMSNSVIRKIYASSDSTVTFSGSGSAYYYGNHVMASTASMNNPTGIALDVEGDIIFSDYNDYKIREISFSGPNITSQSASNAVLCYGIPGTYFVTATGTGNTYQWMVDSGSGYQPLTNNGTFSGVTTDTLHLTLNTSYSISFNCAINGGYVVSQDIYPNLYNPPYLVPYNPENGPGCPGTMVDINVSDYSIGKIKPKAPSSGTDNFYWSTGDTTFSGYGSDIYVSPSVTTTYTVIADNGGCRADTTITVYVYSRSLKANVFPSNKVCQGSSVTIYEVGSGGSFSWSEMGTANNYYTPTVTFTADSSVRYYLSGNDSSGCSDLDSLTITVNPSPTVTVSSLPLNDSVCKGSAVTLTGSGAVSYNWSGGITNGVGFTPSYSAVYYVTGTDANGCTGTNQANVFVRNLPIISASASPSGSVCQGSSVTLDGNGGVSYSWSSGVTNSVPFIPASSGTYTVTGTDAFGCSNSTTLGITINSLPNIKGNAFPSANLCQGSSVALIGTGGSSYAWSGGVNNGVGFTPSSTIT
ncbi:MAG TPA: hypothetical protein VK806_06740, partial [Bacteroidia bacterium]|nr:hypothetical protein [Bacteroidia bacterium]